MLSLKVPVVMHHSLMFSLGTIGEFMSLEPYYIVLLATSTQLEQAELSIS